MITHTTERRVIPYTGFYAACPVRAKVIRYDPWFFGWRFRPRWYVELEVHFAGTWGEMLNPRRDNPAYYEGYGPFFDEELAIRQAHAILDRVESPPPGVTYAQLGDEMRQSTVTTPQTPQWGDVVRSTGHNVTYSLYDPDDEPHTIGMAFVAMLFCGPNHPRLLVESDLTPHLYLASDRDVNDLRDAAQEYLRLRYSNPYVARRILVDGIGCPANLRELQTSVAEWEADRTSYTDVENRHIADVVRMGAQVAAMRDADPEPRPDGLRQIELEQEGA